MRKTRFNREQLNLHHRAMALGQRHREVEAELCACLREVDSEKLHRKLGLSSTFKYATQVLELSESVVYAFISVARKSREVPELKKAIEERRLSISKASRIVSVLTTEGAGQSTKVSNQKDRASDQMAQGNERQSEIGYGNEAQGESAHGENPQAEDAESLIAFASTHTSREIDQKVASLRPEKAKRDRIRPVGKNQFEIRARVSKAVHEKLERLTDILATNGQPTDFESVLDFAIEAALNRKDPVRKAERAIKRTAKRLCLRKAKEVEIETPRQKESTGQEHQVVAGHMQEDRAFQEQPEVSVYEQKSVQNQKLKEVQSQKRREVRGRGESTTQDKLKSDAQGNSQDQPLEHSGDRPYPMSAPKRTPIPGEVKHQVIHRDGARCTHMNERGERCCETRWLELHHLKAVSLRGTNDVSNLTTLCSAHHDLVHQLSFALEGQISWVRERQVPCRAS